MGHGDGVVDIPADATNVLLSAPTMADVENDACAELLTRPADPSELSALVVAHEDSAEDVLTDVTSRLNKEPAKLTVVSVGERQRFSEELTPGGPDAHVPLPSVETVESASDLTSLGIVLSDHLLGWQQRRWDDGPPALSVCYDSLTALLQHVDEQRAYRFLHVMTRRIEDAGATAHFHLDPDAVDAQTVALLRSLFDAAVTVSQDGKWTVQHR